MRLALAIYLAIYAATIAGAGLTIWRSGLIDHLHHGWTMAALAGALLLGVLLAALSRR